MKRTIAIAALCAGIMLTTFPCQAKESGNVKINANIGVQGVQTR